MKKTYNKGFTLPELLASIVILGVLMSVAIASVQSVLNKSHKTYDEEQLAMFTAAAKSYYNDNKSELPVDLMNSKSVNLNTLKKYHYIDNVVDSKKVSCDGEQSKVTVTRYDTGKYAYEGTLVCGGNIIGNSNQSAESNNLDATFGNYTNYSAVYNDDSNSENYIYYTNSSVTVPITLSGKNGMAAYKYTVLKNGKNFKDSEAKLLSEVGKTYEDSLTISKDSYSDGKYQVKVLVYDKAGNKKEVTSSTIWLDTKPPICNINFAGTKGENGWYKEKKVTVTTTQNDVEKGSGVSNYGISTLEKEDYSTKSGTQSDTNQNGVTWYGYVKDWAGNVGKCYATVKVDTIKPSISDVTVSSKNDEYNTTDCNITFSAQDSSPSSNMIKYALNSSNVTYNGTSGSGKTSYLNETASTKCSSSYDGKTHSESIKVVDYAGNVAEESNDYDVYGLCDAEEASEGLVSNCGSCSAACDGGKQKCTLSTDYYDKYFPDKYCSRDSEEIEQECNTFGCCDKTEKIYSSDRIGSDSWCGDCTYHGSGASISATCHYLANYYTYLRSYYDPTVNCGYESRESKIPSSNGTIPLCFKLQPSVSAPVLSCPTISASGTKGNNGWYKSNVSLSFNFSGTKATSYQWYTKKKGSSWTGGTSYNVSTNTKTLSGEGENIQGKLVVKNSSGKTKTCTTSKYNIDKTGPTHKELGMCNPPKSVTCPNGSKYVLKYEIADSSSGIWNSSWKWDPDNNGSKDKSTTNDSNVYKGKKKWWGYICASKKGGDYSYKICDKSGNCTTGTKEIDSSSTVTNCSKHY